MSGARREEEEKGLLSQLTQLFIRVFSDKEKTPKTQENTSLLINILPDELLLKCLSRLEPGDLMAVSEVCRRLHSVAHDNSLWLKFGYENKQAYVKDLRSLALIDQKLEFSNVIKVLLFSASEDAVKAKKRAFWTELSPSRLNTYGIEFSLIMTNIGGKERKLQIWDTTGQERFRAITPSYFRDTSMIAIFIENAENANVMLNYLENSLQKVKTKPLIFILADTFELKAALHSDQALTRSPMVVILDTENASAAQVMDRMVEKAIAMCHEKPLPSQARIKSAEHDASEPQPSSRGSRR